MTRSTRYFLVGSALVITLGLGTGLLAYYNGNLPLGLSGRSADVELAYLPADSAAVGFADVHAIMNSEFRQKLRQVLPTGEELGKFKDELGVDIERDIDTVSAAYLGGAHDSPRVGWSSCAGGSTTCRLRRSPPSMARSWATTRASAC